MMDFDTLKKTLNTLDHYLKWIFDLMKTKEMNHVNGFTKYPCLFFKNNDLECLKFSLKYQNPFMSSP